MYSWIAEYVDLKFATQKWYLVLASHSDFFDLEISTGKLTRDVREFLLSSPNNSPKHIYIIKQISNTESESGYVREKNHRFLAQPKTISRCSIANNIRGIISRSYSSNINVINLLPMSLLTRQFSRSPANNRSTEEV